MRKVILLFAIATPLSCQKEAREIPGVITPEPAIKQEQTAEPPKIASYSNDRFRNVTVTSIGQNQFRIIGEGQIFEANFGWVVEDGHDEIATGHQMTDAGAPEWGKFEFVITVEKQRENSVLHMILFETSAMDGSRQHELPIRLP